MRAASQSKTEWTDRALNGDLIGESTLETAGLGGSFRLGKVAGPIGGADIGIDELTKGLGGTMGAVAGGLLIVSPTGDEASSSSLQEHSEGTLVELSGMEAADSGVVSPE